MNSINSLIQEAADTIEAHLKGNKSHSLNSQEIANLLPELKDAEVTKVIRHLLGTRKMKHSTSGRFVYNYDRVREQKSQMHTMLDSLERAAGMCMTPPPANWLDLFAAELDQNERTIFYNLAKNTVARWEVAYYERVKAGHFDNLTRGGIKHALS